jgi:hypothetical protein
MIGYHYTTYENWLKIKKEGLIPYDLDREEFEDILAKRVKGIWVWTRRFRGIDKLGTLMDRLGYKCRTKLVILEVTFNHKDMLHAYNGCRVYTYHTGSIGNLIYHKKAPSIIIIKRIPPENIKLCAVYDFKQFELLRTETI